MESLPNSDNLARAIRVATTLLLLSLLMLAVIASTELASAGTPEGFDQPAQTGLRTLHTPPLAFVPNAGQLDPAVRYYGRVQGYSVYFSPHEVLLAFEKRARATTTRVSLPPVAEPSQGVTLALTFLGARPDVKPQGQGEEATKINVFRGSDPSKWQTGLPTYREIVYPELWPGVDLVFKRADGRLKYEFLVHPAARTQSIQFAYRGSDSLALDPAGNLLIHTALGILKDERPTSHQVVDGQRVSVETRFALASDRTDAYGFVLGAGYDARYPLVIDPGFQAGDFSTLLGGTGTDIAHAIAVDGSGNAFVAGQTDSPDFPTTTGAYSRTFKGGSNSHGLSDAFVAKLDPSGNPLFVTYLGGSDADAAIGIAVDSAGNPYVTGYTYSSNFPTTPGAFSVKIRGGSDAFVTKLKPDGTGLVYSTFLGGGGFDSGEAITVDSSGSAYVTGQTLSSNFPITPTAFSSSQGKSDAFVTKFTPDGKNVLYSTYLGGTGDDIAYGIAVDAAGNAYVTGETSSPNFPTTAPAGAAPLRSALGGVRDAFVTKVNGNGSALIYSTYLGGSGDDVGYGIALRQGDDGMTALVTGSTNSSNFPTPSGSKAAQSVDAFVVRVNASGSGLIYSTLLGGSRDDHGFGIALDSAGAAYIVGDTASSDLPVTAGATYGGSTDAFVAKLSADGSASLYATFLGGSGPDSGNGVAWGCVPATAGSPTDCAVWIVGQTASLNFPTTSGSAFMGVVDAFVAKLHAKLPTTTTLGPPAPSSSTVFGQSVTFTAFVTATPPGTGTPTGTVTFKDGGVQIGTGTLNGGSATLTINTLSVAPHSITAEYGGDTVFGGSSSLPPPLIQTVVQASTTTSLTVSPSAPTLGAPLTLTATVGVTLPGSGTPTGTVTFMDGNTALGTSTLSGGQASTTINNTTALGIGPQPFTATYSGDSNFAGSGPSGPVGGPVTIQATTTTLIMASVSTTTLGQTITFTATVSPFISAAGTPTGTVTFKDYGVVIGSGTVDATGHATLTTATLGVGLHSITATYDGAANYVPSTSAASDSGILFPTVISAPTVVSTNRTGASALYANCNSQFITITGTNFLPPTAFPPNITVALTPASGITIKEIAFVSSTTLGVQVDVGTTTGSRVLTVTNPDTGTGTSASAILDVGNPNPCPVIGLAPSGTPSGTATPPVISSLVPSSGVRGSTVQVNGSNFGSAPVVTFTGPGNTPVIAAVTSATSGAISVTVPAFPTTSADALDGPVFVTTSGLASNGVAFTVTNPRLSVVTPSSAPPGSVTLDLAGAKLQSGATVQFFNAGTTTLASGITVASATSDGTGQHLTTGLSATAVTGLLDVVVTNPGGATSRLPAAFQVKAPPPAGFSFAVAGADPSTYLPSIDGLLVTLDATGKCTNKSVTPHAVTLTANFTTTVGAPPPTQVTFTISSVSNLPGTATNEDCELGATPTNDFSIGTPSVTSQQVTVPGSGAYQTTLYSYDWGGNVTISVSGVTTVNGMANTTVSGTLSLPVDTDGDKLPDIYEANAALNGNAAGQNVLDRLNKDQNGNGIDDGDDRFAADGLSNFEKYRGVYLSGPPNGSIGPMTGLTRLGSGLRHLFVRGRGFGNDPAIQAAPGTCGIDPSTGTPQPDLTPCPVFQVGAAFFAAGVQVHDVSASFTTGANFPRQSLVNPASPTLDMATIVYDGVNCSAYGCSTSKTGTRNWTFSSLGFSAYGTATAYGANPRVTKKAVDAYFSDKPYQRRTGGLSPCTPSATTPCYVTSDGTTTGVPMLTPLSLVGDSANDNGIKDTSKEVVDASGQLVGDTYVAGLFNLQLSGMDATNDGCVELPFVADPRGISKCNPATDTALSPQATKQQVVRSLITHELGHAAGVNTHTTDATDVMYQSTINWIREGHFSPTAVGLLQIHNKGIQ
jgi:hypothetical protein